MRKVSALKGEGYLVSSASVVLLAMPGWKSASEDPLMLACMSVGMATAIGGMVLRWRSHRLEQAGKRDVASPSPRGSTVAAPIQGEKTC